MHPLTISLLITLLVCFTVDRCEADTRFVGQVMVRANWLWNGWMNTLGIQLAKSPGMPAGFDEDFPEGLKDHYHLTIGVGLFTFYFTWFGQVPTAP